MGGGEGEGFEGWGKGRDVTRQTKRAGGGGGQQAKFGSRKRTKNRYKGKRDNTYQYYN